MYCKLEEKKLKRVGRLRSGVFVICEYQVPRGADYRKGVWHFKNEILRPVKREAWTLSIRESYRQNGKSMKRSAYLFRVSFYDIVDMYKRAMLEGRAFDFFSSTIRAPANAKFCIDPGHATAMVRLRFSPIVDAIVAEFLGTTEYECLSRYVALKLEVNARIKALNEKDIRMAEEEKRRADEYRQRSEEARARHEDERRLRLEEDLAILNSTHKGRVLKMAEELARRLTRRAKMEFHPDRGGSAAGGRANHEKTLIVSEVMDEVEPLLKQFVETEFELVNAESCRDGRQCDAQGT